MSVRADQLFVFVGAGASVSQPAGLPMFNWLREEVLKQLKLDAFVDAGASLLPQIAAGLAPEPFMLALSEAGVAIESWLSEVLGHGQPNAAHKAVAQLADHGARVWTVNFDDLIETAYASGLSRVAWPEEPEPGAAVMKPHGTIGGRLIVTARQVLAPLSDAWLQRLRADVTDRTVIFLGYSGRDLDFQPIWDQVLASAETVLWFDRWDGGRPVDEERKRSLLHRADLRGALRFAAHAPLPAGISRTARANPSWDFVAWCMEHDLARIDSAMMSKLFEEIPPIAYPRLPGQPRWARPAVQGMLGDYAGARASYLHLARRPEDRRKAITALTTSTINHGGNHVAALLAAVTLLPPIGTAATWRETAFRKRLAIWSRTGNHQAVLRATQSLPDDTVSTALILRAASLRITGSLDEAAATADTARRKALIEQHPVRVAHAAFQQCLALMWAERLGEASRCLTEDLEQYAAIAANRWIAWADFIAAGLAVRQAAAHSGDNTDALARFSQAETRFRAEALLDGITSVMTARLAAYRLGRQDSDFRQEHAILSDLALRGERGQRYYTKRNTFTAESIIIERAEFDRVHRNQLDRAWRRYEYAAASRYPLHAALGHLGLALIQAQRGTSPSHATAAIRHATHARNRLVTDRATELSQTPTKHALREVFFC